MKNISKEELNKILREHELWLKGEGGECADLEDTNLSNVDLSYANLRCANLEDADLSNVDLSYANLRGASLSNVDLSNVDLSYANLSCANLENADLSNVDLSYANLRGVDLSCADLINSNLRHANLSCANLEDADLSNVDLSNASLIQADLNNTNLKDIKTNIHTIGYNLACPEKGNFIGYKKANDCIVELLILEDAKRSSATTLKCRCSKAKVLDIEDIYTGKKINYVRSDYDSNFIYKVGEIVSVDDFDEDRWNECSTGIHFFVNKENAIKY